MFEKLNWAFFLKFWFFCHLWPFKTWENGKKYKKLKNLTLNPPFFSLPKTWKLPPILYLKHPNTFPAPNLKKLLPFIYIYHCKNALLPFKHSVFRNFLKNSKLICLHKSLFLSFSIPKLNLKKLGSPFLSENLSPRFWFPCPQFLISGPPFLIFSKFRFSPFPFWKEGKHYST